MNAGFAESAGISRWTLAKRFGFPFDDGYRALGLVLAGIHRTGVYLASVPRKSLAARTVISRLRYVAWRVVFARVRIARFPLAIDPNISRGTRTFVSRRSHRACPAVSTRLVVTRGRLAVLAIISIKTKTFVIRLRRICHLLIE